MEPINLSETGSIKDISDRLVLWAERSPKGLARIEFASDVSQQRVISKMRSHLEILGIAFHEISLFRQQDPETVVVKLLAELNQIPTGVVSITGFTSAFTNKIPLEESLRILNFNRERLVAPTLNQIWWMTPSFLQTSVHVMPDLNRWFSPRLQLTELVLLEPAPLASELILNRGVYANFDDAYRRAHNLLQRFEESRKAGTPDRELLVTYLLPALEALAEVGAQKELQDLTMQFEGLLGQLKVVNSPELAISLARIANLYFDQGRYSEAEPLYLRSLSICEQRLGADHPDTAGSLNNLASLYKSQGRYSEAEPLYLRSLLISERQLGADHPYTADRLNNLASLYKSQGRYSEAEPLYLRSLQIREQQLGADHPSTAGSLNNLAELYRSQGRYSEAEPLYLRSLQIREQQLGADHPSTLSTLNNLVFLYESQGRFSEAGALKLRFRQLL